MFEALWPGGGLEGAPAALAKWFWLIAGAAVAYGAWRTHWRSRYARRMRQTFENANLFVRPKKDKLFPQLLSLSSSEDEVYYVFRYRLRPGMTVPQFEEKKKTIEAAFHAEARVFGKGGMLTIKVKKQRYPLTPAEQSQSNPLL